MSERFRWSWSRLRGPLLVLSILTTSVVAAACSENLEGGAACPTLCPSRSESFRDTTFDAVVLDSSVGGYPVLGLSQFLLLANRPDTLITRGVLRYDILTSSYAPNKTGALDSISTVDSVYLHLPLDTTGSRGIDTVTIEAFDIDTTVNDSVAAVVKSLFRADRRIGSLKFVPFSAGDSLRIPIRDSVIEYKIRNVARLRVGLRLTGASGQVRILAFSGGYGAPFITYDPATDTTYAPIAVTPNTAITLATAETELAYQVYGLTDLGSPPPPAQTLTVGGFPAYRSYLRFNVPAHITDSSTIVRAEVLLTQRRSLFGSSRDTVTIVPLVPTTTTTVTDLRRILDLAAEGIFASIDSAKLVPSDSGLRTLNVLALVRTWPSLPANVPRALAFRIGNEGSAPAELRFFSSKAPLSVRPRLRITYLPRSEFALP
jgi:hypothetical protein